MALARTGARVDVFEQATTPREFGAGLQLGPNAMRVLGQLGLTECLAPFAHHPARIKIASATSGQQIAVMQLEAFEKRFGAPYCTFSRPDLHNALTQTATNAGAHLHYGVKVKTFAQSDTGIFLAFEDRAAWQGAGVIGADGLWSKLRSQLSGQTRHNYTGHTAWRATLPLAQVPKGISQTDVGLFLAANAHIVHYPIGADLLNLVVVVEGKSTTAGWQQPGDRGELLDRVSNLAGPVVALVEAAQDICRWPLFATRPARTCGSGRATLIGDAAHPMLPYLAAGAAMGIEDAWVLAQTLDDTKDIATAMRQFEQARAARIDRVQEEARKNAMRFHLRSAPAFMRDSFLGAASRVAPGFLAARLDWLYGGGPV